MDYKRMTVYFICLTIVAIAGYDVFVISKGGVETSISMQMIQWAHKYPAFPFLMGFTMGHLFWRMGDNSVTKKIAESFKKDK